MAWIESHQQIERHPKTLRLMKITGRDTDSAIGLVHRFWWWCMDYAENGQLARYSTGEIDQILGGGLTEALIGAGWIDDNPLRVHDWWDYAGPFLRSRYKREPERWQAIRDLYCTSIVPVTGNGHLTKPNLTNQPNQPVGAPRQASQSEAPRQGVCDYKYVDQTRCSAAREPRAFFCRDHILKFRELKAAKGDKRGGGFKQVGAT